MTPFLCNDTLPEPPSNKVDAHGRFNRWEGVTVIQPLHASSAAAAAELHAALSLEEDITSVISLLPSESYHVTLRGAVERVHMGSGRKLNEWVREHWSALRDLDVGYSATFARTRQAPPLAMTATWDAATACGGGRLWMHAGPALEEVLRSCEAATVHALHMSTADPPQRWHVSLGYLFARSPDEDALSRATASMTRVVASFLERHGATLHFELPRVCHYSDMTAFTPMTQADGRKN